MLRSLESKIHERTKFQDSKEFGIPGSKCYRIPEGPEIDPDEPIVRILIPWLN